jgi:hypothetical protein
MQQLAPVRGMLLHYIGLIVTILSYSNANAPLSFIIFAYYKFVYVITATIFELIIYAASILSWIKNTNANFEFMFTY